MCNTNNIFLKNCENLKQNISNPIFNNKNTLLVNLTKEIYILFIYETNYDFCI